MSRKFNNFVSWYQNPSESPPGCFWGWRGSWHSSLWSSGGIRRRRAPNHPPPFQTSRSIFSEAFCISGVGLQHYGRQFVVRRVSLEGLHRVGEGGRAANFTRGLCHLTGNGKKKINKTELTTITRAVCWCPVFLLLLNPEMFIRQLIKCTVGKPWSFLQCF